MKVLQLSFACLFLLLSGGLTAQGTPVPATNDSETVETTDLTISDLTEEEPLPETKRAHSMLELGITPSYTWIGGDVTATGGYGTGIHLRKSLDHLFSLRLDGLYAASSGDNGRATDNNRRFETRWLSSTGYAVITMNNFTFRGDIRKLNVYIMLGAGANFFQSAAQRNREIDSDNPLPFDEENTFENDGRGNFIVDRKFASHIAVGSGINFRVNDRFNFGVEYQGLAPFGKRADLIDGYKNGGNFRDVQNVVSLGLNVNLGKRETHVEPRYWTNVFSPIREDLASMNTRVDNATTDSDGDGVVDAVDQEANTPAGVPVDTRGRVLDSDKDGVPDYKDLEPFFPPRAGETVDANGVVVNRKDKPITEDRVQEMIDASLSRYLEGDQNNTTMVRTNRGEIYLPMIYFPLNQSTIKYSDYGTLSSVARVLQGNPGMQMVIRGYTDRTGTSAGNETLSYRRAKAVVDHLVNQHGLERERLILQYRGENNAIVPLNKSQVNRRVEFLTAEVGATEDPAPGDADNDGGF